MAVAVPGGDPFEEAGLLKHFSSPGGEEHPRKGKEAAPGVVSFSLERPKKRDGDDHEGARFRATIHNLRNRWPEAEIFIVVSRVEGNLFNLISPDRKTARDEVPCISPNYKSIQPDTPVLVRYRDVERQYPYFKGGAPIHTKKGPPLLPPIISAELIWGHAQGCPELDYRSRSPYIWLGGSGYTESYTMSRPLSNVLEAPLGVIAYTTLTIPTLVYLYNREVTTGRFKHVLEGLRADGTWESLWFLEFGLHDANTTGPSSLLQGHLFLDESIGCLFVVGRSGELHTADVEGKTLRVVNSVGQLLATKVCSYLLECSSVGCSHLIKGWHTNSGYDLRRQQDPLVRALRFAYSDEERRIVDSWTLDPTSLFASGWTVASSGRSLGGWEGRWPIDTAHRRLYMWVSGRSPDDLTQRASIAGLNVDTGIKETEIFLFNNASAWQEDMDWINAWVDYYTTGPGTPFPSQSYFPSGGFNTTEFVGYVGDLIFDLSFPGVTLTGGSEVTVTCSTDDSESYLDQRTYNQPWSITNPGPTVFPDKTAPLPGHQVLMPFCEDSDSVRTEEGEDITLWPVEGQDNFANSDVVGGLMTVDRFGLSPSLWSCWMEPEPIIIGGIGPGAEIVCTTPIQQSGSQGTEGGACGPDLAGVQQIHTVGYSTHWQMHLVGVTEYYCRTWLVRKNSAGGEDGRWDISKRYSVKIKLPDGSFLEDGGDPVYSSILRGSRDNVYYAVALRGFGSDDKLALLRNDRDTLYGGTSGVDHLPFFELEIRDWLVPSNDNILASYNPAGSTDTVEVTLEGVPTTIRKWHQYEAKPTVRAGNDFSGNPWICVQLVVKDQENDWLESWAWRFWWTAGLAEEPTIDLFTWPHGYEWALNNAAEAGSLALFGSFGAWIKQITVAGVIDLPVLTLS